MCFYVFGFIGSIWTFPFWSSWLWNSFDFCICEILLTFGGTTLLKGIFYQRFDTECTFAFMALGDVQDGLFWLEIWCFKGKPYLDWFHCNS